MMNDELQNSSFIIHHSSFRIHHYTNPIINNPKSKFFLQILLTTKIQKAATDMALIGKIREKGTLILILMVLAIGGFIIMEIMSASNKGGNGGPSSSTMGKVNGKALEYNEFQKKEKEMYANRSGGALAARREIWDFFVDEAVISKEAKAIGLGVCRDEVKQLMFGSEFGAPCQIVRQAVVDQSGQFDPKQLEDIKTAIQAKKQLSPEFVYKWRELEKQAIKSRLQEKITNLVSKGLYTPTWMADAMFADMTQTLDFQYVKVPFDLVNDNDKDVTLTDADYSTYLQDNRNKYFQEEETRKVDYISLEVNPSMDDSTRILGDVTKLLEGMKAAANDSAFVALNNGRMDEVYRKADAVSPELKKYISGAAKGTVIGPYIENKAYWLAKVVDKKTLPDSVKSRHILKKVTKMEELAGAQRLMDSLKSLAERGYSWDSLNVKNNEDPGAAMKGGDLGYVAQGAMVPEFNKLIFETAAQGKFYTVTTQFGVHLVQVTGVKAGKADSYKMSYIIQPIVPSDATTKSVENTANNLLDKNHKSWDALKKAAIEKGFKAETSQPLKSHDASVGVLSENETARSIVKWAYEEAKINSVAPKTYSFQDPNSGYINKYVLVGLKTVQAKGIPSVAAIKEDLTPLVKNRKKGEVLRGKLKTAGQDLNAIATSYNVKIDTSKGATFNAPFTPGVGNEPLVTAAAFTTALNAVSQPVLGESGVFVVQPIQKSTPPEAPADKTGLRNQLTMGVKSQVRGKLVQALRKKATITDNRNQFF
jgi:peptidyl-prolyl cis-trans isomerase D